MPENGEIPNTGDPRVDAALQRIRGKFKCLGDALVVQIQLEKRDHERQERWLEEQHKVLEMHNRLLQSRNELMLKRNEFMGRHQEWLAEQEEAIRRHGEWLAARQAADEKFDLKMREMDEKINFLIDREMRREGGPEAAA